MPGRGASASSHVGPAWLGRASPRSCYTHSGVTGRGRSVDGCSPIYRPHRGPLRPFPGIRGFRHGDASPDRIARPGVALRCRSHAPILSPSNATDHAASTRHARCHSGAARIRFRPEYGPGFAAARLGHAPRDRTGAGGVGGRRPPRGFGAGGSCPALPKPLPPAGVGRPVARAGRRAVGPLPASPRHSGPPSKRGKGRLAPPLGHVTSSA